MSDEPRIRQEQLADRTDEQLLAMAHAHKAIVSELRKRGYVQRYNTEADSFTWTHPSRVVQPDGVSAVH